MHLKPFNSCSSLKLSFWTTYSKKLNTSPQEPLVSMCITYQTVSLCLHRITELYNKSGWKGRDLWRSSSPTPCSKQVYQISLLRDLSSRVFWTPPRMKIYPQGKKKTNTTTTHHKPTNKKTHKQTNNFLLHLSGMSHVPTHVHCLSSHCSAALRRLCLCLLCIL